MEAVLKKYFGYAAFRASQKEVINEVLCGKDCLVVMATGSGKSLCYQLPPLITGKTAVVISPLLSLMQDQVMSLKQRDIKAEYLGSSQTDQTAHSSAERGQFDILYMTPEKACSVTSKFWSNLLMAGICLLAVDEAHCISEWGHDFRKEYKQLDKLRNSLIGVPFLALTATATEKVRMDIIHSLKMKDPYISIRSFDRKNLFYGVKPLSRSYSFVDELVKEISKYAANAGSTIIYCTTVKDTEEIFKSLQEAGVNAGIYHGQMSSKARTNSHRAFVRDDIQVMVATIAFGMGIDKPNVRCVIHYGCPKSLESYYQESGRCGRDGLPSICWLYYSRSDFAKADFYCAEAQTEKQRKAILDSFMAAQKYCMLSSCRRKFLLEYFAEQTTFTKCGNCDNCTSTRKEKDMSKEAFLLLSCIRSCGGRWGLNLPIDVIRGSRARKVLDNQYDKLPEHGLGRVYSSNWWKALSDQLLANGYLKETVSDMYRTVSVSATGLEYLRTANSACCPPLVLPLTDEMLGEEESGSPHGNVSGDLSSDRFEELSEEEAKMLDILFDFRKKLAESSGTAPYAICGDQTIKKIAKLRPSTKARLANIDGVNQHLVANYGDQFLQHISHFSQVLNLSLDAEAAPVQTVSTKKENSNSQRKLAPAKFSAWKMWMEDGLTCQEIANLPGRAARIKEGTVLEYILEAAREGYEICWARFCREIELTYNLYRQIQAAIAKVSTAEKLKPIKDELPEHVSYVHIKAYLAMQQLGVSKEEIEGYLESQKSEMGEDPIAITKQPRSGESQDDDIPATKYQKVETENANHLKAEQSSILEWLEKHKEVSLYEIAEHFNGSSREALADLLNTLEAEFFIFKKNDMYRVM